MREELAARQREVVRALLTGGSPPTGFDPDRVAAEARALLSKRRSAAAKLRPDLVERLGAEFRPLFDAWAVDHPKPVALSFRADLDRFESWLHAAGRCTRPAGGPPSVRQPGGCEQQESGRSRGRDRHP
jgi:hypothetical protein